tara:strand:+ start:234 stop:2123 length:1890 start_codon:yes stop_codon:yes gene_type:complete
MNPEQMTNEELLKMYKGDPSLLSDEALLLLRGQQEPVKEPKAVPEKPVVKPEPTFEGSKDVDVDFGDIESGFLKGIKDPIDAGAQLLPRALSFLTSFGGLKPNELSDFFRNEATRIDALVKEEEKQYQEERGEEGFDTDRLLGNILNPTNIAVGLRAAQAAGTGIRLKGMEKGVKLGRGATGQAAISGGAVGALTPVTEGDFTQEKIKQTGVGAVGGVIGDKIVSGGSRILKPLVSKSEQAMRDLGVRPMIGQSLGGMAKSAEEFAKFIPVVGGAIDDRAQKNISNFNKGIIKNTFSKINKTVGQEFDNQNVVGSKAVESLDKFIKETYETLLSKDSPLSFEFNNVVKQDLLSNLQEQSLDNRKVIKQVTKWLNDNVGDKLKITKEFKNLTAQQYKNIQTSLRQEATSAFKKENNQLGNAYVAIGDVFKKAFYKQNENVKYTVVENGKRVTKNMVDTLKATDEGFSKVIAMIEATANTRDPLGIFSPELYNSALRKTDLSRNKRGYAFDTRPGAKEAKQAEEVLGTDAEFYKGREVVARTTRGAGAALGLGGGAAAIGTGVAGVPSALMGFGGLLSARLLYTETGQNILDLLIRSRPGVSKKAGEVLERIPTGVRAVTGAELGQGMMSE